MLNLGIGSKPWHKNFSTEEMDQLNGAILTFSKYVTNVSNAIGQTIS